jgi:hypothetical protein
MHICFYRAVPIGQKNFVLSPRGLDLHVSSTELDISLALYRWL